MATSEYVTKTVQRKDGEHTNVLRVGPGGNLTRLVSYSNPHSADALVRLLNNQKDQEA